MKKYFAKYIPVEGKPMLGDKVITIAGFLKNYDGFVDVEAPTLVKLFLCSRDIKVGEEFTSPYGDKQICTEITSEFIRGDKYIYSPRLSFKILEQVPSEAIWIKEDDEFDDEDIKQIYACEKGDECDLLHGEQICSAPHQIKEPVKIKCPCCNRF